MIAALAKFIDWYALQFAAMLPSIRKCARGDSKLTLRGRFYACTSKKLNRDYRLEYCRAVGQATTELGRIFGVHSPLSLLGPKGVGWGEVIVAAGLEINTEQPILLVENNQDDILLILRAFQRAGVNRHIQVVTSGMDAVDCLQGKHPYDDREKYPLPALVLLDIKMPGMDGFEVLRWIRQQWEFFELCVVMLTNSDHISDANQAYHLGANSFLVKPLDFQNAAELARSLNTLMAK